MSRRTAAAPPGQEQQLTAEQEQGQGTVASPPEEIVGEARSIRTAIAQLLRAPSITYLFVHLPKPIARDDLQLFPLFVTALERHGGSLGALHIMGAPFGGAGIGGGGGDNNGAADGAAALRPEDLDRLFGAVLPSLLPRLDLLILGSCEVHPRWLRRLLLSAEPADVSNNSGMDSPGRGLRLHLIDTPLSYDACRALARGVRRGALGRLTVRSARLDASSCKVLVRAAFASAPSMSRLKAFTLEQCPRTLTLTDDTWSGGEGGRAPSSLSSLSPLRSLAVGAGWTAGGLAELLRQLRTNASLEALELRRAVAKGALFAPLRELLATYNFTLARVEVRVSGWPEDRRSQIAALLRRNERVRAAHGRLRRRGYRVDEPSLWPIVLERIGAFPTLVHRFLRQGGNAAALSDVLRSRPRGGP
jgi:hypothetical protein